MLNLEFATNQELIDELMSRPHFVGLLIHHPDPKEIRTGNKVKFNEFILETTLGREEVESIISQTARVVENNEMRYMEA